MNLLGTYSDRWRTKKIDSLSKVVDRRALELFLEGSSQMIHVFPPNGDGDSAKLRLSQYVGANSDFEAYQERVKGVTKS